MSLIQSGPRVHLVLTGYSGSIALNESDRTAAGTLGARESGFADHVRVVGAQHDLQRARQCGWI